MERNRRRNIAIGALALAIVAIVAFRTFGTSRSGGDLPSAASQPAPDARSQTPNPKEQVTRVNLEALDGDRPEPVDSTRNPFGFKPKPPPPPPPRPTDPGRGIGIPEGPLGPSVPPPPPPPPRISLKFIGIMGSAKTGLIANLTDGRSIMQGKEGEVIEGRYRIMRIGVESIDLAYLDGRGRQTIRLTGQ